MKEISRALTRNEEIEISIVKSYCEEFNKFAIPILSIFGYTSDGDLLRWGRDGMNFKKLFENIEEAPAFKGWDPRLAKVAADQALVTSCDYRLIRTRILDPVEDKKIIFEIPRLQLHAKLILPELLAVEGGRLVVSPSAIRRINTNTVKAELSFFKSAAQKFVQEINEWIDDAPDLDLKAIFKKGPDGKWTVIGFEDIK